MKSILNIKQALLILSACFCLHMNGQNLVINNSFEIIDSCHMSLSSNDCTASYAPPCYCPNGGTSDIFLSCNGSVPNNLAFGYQAAQDGGNYIGIVSYSKYSPNVREYITLKLSTTLTQYQAYRVGFYLSLAEQFNDFGVNNMGALISDTVINQGQPGVVLMYSPQIVNTSGSLTDQVNWTLVADTFYSSGNEKYITIGNFFNDANTNAILTGLGGGHDSSAYYYIDNVFAEEIPGLIGTKEFTVKEPKIKLYPNPNTGEFTIEQNEGLACDFQIFDINGKLVGKYSLKGSSNIIKLNNIDNGIYFYTIASGDKILKRDKIVVIH